MLRKNDWRSLSISAKYIVHDHIVSVSDPYTISIRDDQHIGSNLNDIEWLCQMISSNAALRSLSLRNCRYLCEFSRWHYLMHHGFLMLEDQAGQGQYERLEQIRVDGHAHFGDECLKMLLHVIAAKCPALTHLHLARTDVSDESVKALVAFLEEPRRQRHPLWSVNLEFCAKVGDAGLCALRAFLRRHPVKKMYLKCTSHSHNDSGLGVREEDQRLSVSMYPT